MRVYYVCACVCVCLSLSPHTHTHIHTRTRSGAQCNGGTRKVTGEVLSSFQVPSPAYYGWLSFWGKAKKAKVKPNKRVLATSFFYIPNGPHFIFLLEVENLKGPHSKYFAYIKPIIIIYLFLFFF
jgi:hypothetical protein